MTTNLTSVMARISMLTNEFYSLQSIIRMTAFSTKAIELTGNEQILEAHPEFNDMFTKMLETATEITKLKGVIAKKNIEFKLEDGRTIQEALADIAMSRRIIDTLTNLSTLNNSKRRVTETNNSYFECKELNFNKEDIIAQLEVLKETTEKTEYEISKLNAIDFEIE